MRMRADAFVKFNRGFVPVQHLPFQKAARFARLACEMGEQCLAQAVAGKLIKPINLDYIPNRSRRSDIDYAMSNSFGFGGHNATLVFGRP